MESESGARGKPVRIVIDQCGQSHEKHPELSVGDKDYAVFQAKYDCTLIFTDGIPFGGHATPTIELKDGEDRCESLCSPPPKEKIYPYYVCPPQKPGQQCQEVRFSPQDVVITS